MDITELRCARCGRTMDLVRYRCEACDLTVDGRFSPPPLARLSAEDQYFVMAFVHCHGSIKEMERIFGISYPTVKNRLHRLGEQLELVETSSMSTREEVLNQLEHGEITAEEAIERLSR